MRSVTRTPEGRVGSDGRRERSRCAERRVSRPRLAGRCVTPPGGLASRSGLVAATGARPARRRDEPVDAGPRAPPTTGAPKSTPRKNITGTTTPSQHDGDLHAPSRARSRAGSRRSSRGSDAGTTRRAAADRPRRGTVRVGERHGHQDGEQRRRGLEREHGRAQGPHRVSRPVRRGRTAAARLAHRDDRAGDEHAGAPPSSPLLLGERDGRRRARRAAAARPRPGRRRRRRRATARQLVGVHRAGRGVLGHHDLGEHRLERLQQAARRPCPPARDHPDQPGEARSPRERLAPARAPRPGCARRRAARSGPRRTTSSRPGEVTPREAAAHQRRCRAGSARRRRGTPPPRRAPRRRCAPGAAPSSGRNTLVVRRRQAAQRRPAGRRPRASRRQHAELQPLAGHRGADLDGAAAAAPRRPSSCCWASTT